ncbi:MAG TPA: hypothetical protein VK927_10785 [Adhaeribacter sp.]|nr:hypothetical protein [Adhaeribacter sp.]
MTKRKRLFKYYSGYARKVEKKATIPKEFFISLFSDTQGQDQERLRVEVFIENGKVIYLVVQYETLVEAEWLPVVRYDNAHQFFHQDLMDLTGRQVEKTIIKVSDLNAALTYSINDLKENWEKYRTRFLRSGGN